MTSSEHLLWWVAGQLAMKIYDWVQLDVIFKEGGECRQTIATERWKSMDPVWCPKFDLGLREFFGTI